MYSVWRREFTICMAPRRLLSGVNNAIIGQDGWDDNSSVLPPQL